MSAQKTQWVNAAPLESVPPGQARAVRLGRERSIALFNEGDKIYATDNQCPHMGYPLVRGVVRHGVLTCDWHGRSFDLAGGGCFNRECDDLQTFAVEVRGPDIWVEVPEPSYRRREEHLSLLWEGLLSCDRWTQSKAIALLLRGDVPQDDIVELVVRHLGRHIASSHEARGRPRRGTPAVRPPSSAALQGRRPSDRPDHGSRSRGRGRSRAIGCGSLARSGGVGLH